MHILTVISIPVASIAISTPSLLCVRQRICSSALESFELTTAVAPFLFANSSLLSSMSTAIICPAPKLLTT